MNRRLFEILQSGQIPHALLFCGPKSPDKKEAAYHFSLQLLKTTKPIENHPDAHLLFPEGKTDMHTITSIRQMIHDAALAPFEAHWKIFILHDAEKMLPTSSNALLKILEEPPPQTLIILLTDHPERLLPTVLSRCQTINFLSGEKKNIDPHILALICANFPREKISEFESEQAEVLFETILLWYRDRLLLEVGGSEELLHFPEHIEQLKQMPFIPFEKVEKAVNKIRLAFERMAKLSHCLEIFRLSLQE